MKSIKELLILVDREIDGMHFKTGICNLIMKLWFHCIIEREEWYKLETYIYVNNPDVITMDGWDNDKLSEGLLWWSSGDKKPRHKYLQILIENCDED